ncbi:MBL fold metallo-hydrolase [uncultured Enterococcus sp.]|uniref:MBL fold metallo-hydrolase n=1 Tax=uncultured Enterococcus sp. TaxID=167972 RepID=UPI002AA79E42|nr:MBL fold metallo-hydrolase [uncultured Enterococcus sp.]
MQKTIEAINYYACGYCTNNQATLFKQEEKKELLFPAGVFLLKHKSRGYILYDTGYTTELYQKKWLYRIYNHLNPTVIDRKQMIDYQLNQSGVRPEEIRLVILSHLHPDHIGGTKYFPNARFLLSEECFQAYKKNKFKSLIFHEFLPTDFDERIERIAPREKQSAFPYKEACDLFGDGSILLSSFDGHAKGQLCMYLPEHKLFVAADICWGIDLLEKTKKIRRIPAMIQDDITAYKTSIQYLKAIMADGNQIVVSHDPEKRIREVLG